MNRAYFDVPSDIVECATKLRTYFDERNIKDWQLDGICRAPQGPTKYVRCIPYAWDSIDVSRAAEDGWLLSERSDGFLEIQKVDETDMFESDVAAQAFVRDKAIKLGKHGYHHRAWQLHATRWYKG